MSQVYVLEPPTKGKVVLRTTLGDLDIELWPKEAPKAVRNFVQLCLEGYYDGTIFHRVIKDFMAQGGDPTGTGEGGESIYGQPFRDELHSRLKFNHRGLVACANQNRPHTNGSQFFVTLDRADHCDKQYTIFGKVTGDTIYNLLRFNELDTDDNDRPEQPPVLTRADVLWNPFEDIVPRVDRDAKEAAAKAAAERQAAEAKAAAKKAATKNFALMSFGDEAEEEDQEATAAAQQLKIRSAHDALEDERLSKEAALEVDLDKVRAAMRAAKQQAAATAHESATQQQQGEGEGGEQDFGSRMRQQLQAKRKALGHEAAAAAEGGKQQQQQEGKLQQEQVPKGSKDASRGAESDREEAGSSDEESGGRRSSKRSRLAELPRGRNAERAAVLPSRQIKVADAELLTEWERRRQEYKQRKRLGGNREKETMGKLAEFEQRLKAASAARAAAAAAAAEADKGGQQQQQQEAEGEAEGQGAGYSGQVRDDIDHRPYMPAAWRVDQYLQDDESDEDTLASLKSHRLAFNKEQFDAMARKESVDDYVVYDPLAEAKAKFNKQQQRARKKQSEWAGRANL